MARVHGKDVSTISVDDSGGTPVAMKADTIAVGFNVSVAQHDTTTIGDSWFETTSGLKGGDDFTHEIFYDNTNSTGNWAIYTARLGISGTFTISDGTRTVQMETVVTKLSLPIAVGDMMKATATHKINGAVVFS